MSEVFFVQNGWIQDSRIQDFLQSSIWVRMNEWSFFCSNGWIQDGRIQDGCRHLVSQIQLVWVRIRVEGECFWVNLREDNKVSEPMMAVSESKMAVFKMASIIKLSQNEWVTFFFEENGWIHDGRIQDGRIQDGRIQDGCHHQAEWEWMRLCQIKIVWVRVLCKMAESKMAEFKMVAII